jgi:uncharacterized protein (DUF1778 family)
LIAVCQPTEQTLPDQRVFMVSGTVYQSLLDLLEQAEQANPGLADLFSRPVPWQTK